jgi:uncharacterized membrane protein
MSDKRGIGSWFAPPRFIAFAVILFFASALAISQCSWRTGVMIGFDAAALVFLLSCLPMLRHRADDMRRSASRNDANRFILLLVTGAVTFVILAAVASELMQQGSTKPGAIVLIVATLALAWVFSNAIYTLHYAHLFYTAAKGGGDSKGFNFPETAEPDYWDFLYFAFCLGMTFQTSDVEITDSRIRRVVTLHCVEAFVFNLGIVAFTINVLGG